MGVGKILKGHDLFQSLGLDEAHGLSEISIVRKFEADEVIFRFGDPGDHIFMLMSGSVELRLPNKSQEASLLISKIEKGELFGLSPMLDSPNFTASAICQENTEVLSIDAAQLRDVLQKNCAVGFNFMNQVALIYFNRYIGVLKNLQQAVSKISLTQ